MATEKANEGLSTEAHTVLDATLSSTIIEVVGWRTGLSAAEVAMAFKEVRQAVGREV